jgi:hypothetical protein
MLNSFVQSIAFFNSSLWRSLQTTITSLLAALQLNEFLALDQQEVACRYVGKLLDLIFVIVSQRLELLQQVPTRDYISCLNLLNNLIINDEFWFLVRDYNRRSLSGSLAQLRL